VCARIHLHVLLRAADTHAYPYGNFDSHSNAYAYFHAKSDAHAEV
jgi:hypothetical protein